MVLSGMGGICIKDRTNDKRKGEGERNDKVQRKDNREKQWQTTETNYEQEERKTKQWSFYVTSAIVLR